MTIAFKERIDPGIRERFDLNAGWRYGLIVGILVVLAAWGADAWQLVSAAGALAWAKLVLATLVVIPLSIIAGLLDARVLNLALKWLVWVAWGILTGIFAGYLPFTAPGIFAFLLDPVTRGLSVFPIGPETQFLGGFSAFWGAVLAFPIAFVQVWATGRAWDRSDENNRFTPVGWLALAVVLPAAVALGLLWDSFDNSELRAPISLVDRVIQFGLHAPKDQDVSDLDERDMLIFVAGAVWRDRFTPHYTLYRVAVDPGTYQSATVDAAFDNGFVLRCGTSQYGGAVAGCFDVGSEYHDMLAQFLKTGQAPCKDCQVEVLPTAARWQADNAAHLDDPIQISVIHHSGGLVVLHAAFANQPPVECRVEGADPVRLIDCVNGGY